MHAANKDVVKDVTSAGQLEGELQLAQAQHGVAVLDVYNAEWGAAKALNETFRRLFTDAGDVVYLRFFSVECNSVLKSLDNPDDKAPARKGMEFAPDTTRAGWKELLAARVDHSKPYFCFYKEGKFRGSIEGIDTPRIAKKVRDLCREQHPAADYLTNADAAAFWGRYLSAEDSEADQRAFADAVQSYTGRSLSGAATHLLLQRVGATDGSVSAAGLQSWLGDDATIAERVAEIAAEAESASSPAQSPSAGAADGSAGDSAGGSAARAAPEREPEPAWEHRDSNSPQMVRVVRDDSHPMYPGGSGSLPSVSAHGEAAEGTDFTASEKVEVTSRARAAPSAGGDQPHSTHVDRRESNDIASAASPHVSTQVAALASSANGSAAAYPTEEGGAPSPLQPVAVDRRESQDISKAASPHLSEQTASMSAAAASPTMASRELGEPLGALRSAEEESAQQALYPTEEEAAGERGDLAAGGAAAAATYPTEGAAEEGLQVLRDTETRGSTVNQVFTDHWVSVTDAELAVWNAIAELPLRYPAPEYAVISPGAEPSEERARALLPDGGELPTLAEDLRRRGKSEGDVSMMCLSADNKVGSESLSLGKLALVAMTGTPAPGEPPLLPGAGDCARALEEGTLLEREAPLAFTAMCLCASEAGPNEAFYYAYRGEEELRALQALEEGGEATLAALAPLRSNGPPPDGVAVRVVGLPKVLEAATTEETEAAMVLSQWYARLRLESRGEDGSLTLRFVENVCGAEFDAFAAAYTARLLEEEQRLDKKREGDFKTEL